ncbi:MAG: DUF4956 domain-containing protein [Candidatus Marinimicrobia bacterium]|nr:DUF4956 domain-containing protein [Candidatus Neomarinimicrobiota bacterium]
MSNLMTQLLGGAQLSLDFSTFIICLGASLLAAWLAELMYCLFYENRALGSQIHRSFILLGPAITFLFISIQLSLPLSLGLLGALSIVRFRTPIKEPEEIGFLMLLIAGSIGIATFNFVFVGWLYLVLFIVLAARRTRLLKGRFGTHREGLLLLQLEDAAYAAHTATLRTQLATAFPKLRLESLSATEGLTSLQYTFSGSGPTDWAQFQSDLQAAVPLRKLSLFFRTPGSAT